ncbi:clotting factor B-like [Penaeus japonicus]|uniref:clotting factor B-like n=1 Tax=Penaeus japonicus TaxID=27405 RepID=UPI001C710B5B|nr:clotting factor B-like [Penaeus japonicus]
MWPEAPNRDPDATSSNGQGRERGRGETPLTRGNPNGNRGDEKDKGEGTDNKGQGGRTGVESVETRADRKHVGIQDICGENIVLSYDQSAIVYTVNNDRPQTCKLKVKTPAGTNIGISCLTFDIYSGSCKKESLMIKARVNGRPQRLLYCEDVPLRSVIISSNKMFMRYKRKKLEFFEYSGGFICEVYTSGGSARPFCDGCGFVPINIDNTRIVNGTDASSGEYPYMVIVRPTMGTVTYSCGGSIIKRNWILTAAHCFFDLDTGLKASIVEVRYGSINYNRGTIVTSTVFITHPEYDNATYANDVALVRLPEPLQYQSDPNLRPICLGLDEDNLFSGKAVATGWGRTSYGGTRPDILQEVELDLISMSECEAKIRLPADTSRVLCTLTPYKDTCQGDSGSPLVVEIGFGRWVQVGINSYGIECARPQYPSVYMRVSAYVDWITCHTGGSDCDAI